MSFEGGVAKLIGAWEKEIGFQHGSAACAGIWLRAASRRLGSVES